MITFDYEAERRTRAHLLQHRYVTLLPPTPTQTPPPPEAARNLPPLARRILTDLPVLPCTASLHDIATLYRYRASTARDRATADALARLARNGYLVPTTDPATFHLHTDPDPERNPNGR